MELIIYLDKEDLAKNITPEDEINLNSFSCDVVNTSLIHKASLIVYEDRVLKERHGRYKNTIKRVLQVL